MMQRISSRLIQHRSWTRYNASHIRDRDYYEVKIRPPSGMDIATQEDRARWYKSFLEACKIDPNEVKTTYKKDHAILFQGGLFYDQAERVPIMDGFISMKRMRMACCH